MKNVAVVCNNIHEWKHFVDCFIWNLSKQNLPYKAKYQNYFIDKSTDTKYHFISNVPPTMKPTNEMVWDDYITLTKVVDEDLLKWLGGKK